MARFVCVHGHYYQPPRENPWLESVEYQETAQPFHDWNERITAECYRPNSAARVVDAQRFLTQIQSNYAWTSFDFGPTLLHWLEGSSPDTYEAVVRADRESQERFGGHGSALVQPYNHQILPLAAPRDKRTQVVWGVRDFRRRFGRAPEGAWLPEAAVDDETLGILAENGIAFTVLAPHQARRFRRIGEAEWTEANGNPPALRPYRVAVPGSDRSIAVFFYDGPASHDLAFGGLLDDGQLLADRLRGGFSSEEGAPDELVHIATDGETYGHHHRYGEMALAYALESFRSKGDVRITNYGEFLAGHPPEYEAEIVPNTSWSCAHGVERWRSNCGCNSGMHPGWQQTWRGPLRAAFDWLRDALYPRYEAALRPLIPDPWAARDEYVDVAGTSDGAALDEFLERHAGRTLSPAEGQRALEMLEMQRHLQQMYTSCGWFFDDLGGIETVQCLQYAARAIQLAERGFGERFEDDFRARLASAHGNVRENGDGAQTYDRLAGSARIDLASVCGHYAMSSLFEDYSEPARVFRFAVERVDRQVRIVGATRLAYGHARVRSELTREEGEFTYAALHLGGHNLLGGVRPFRGDETYRATAAALDEAFEKGDLPGTIRALEAEFGHGTYSLRLLFRDEQRKIVARLLASTIGGVEASFRQIYESTGPILRFLADSGSTPPRSLQAATEFFADLAVQRDLDEPVPKVDEVAGWLRQLASMRLRPDPERFRYAWTGAAGRVFDAFAAQPDDPALLARLEALTELPKLAGVDVDTSPLQNRYFAYLHDPAVAARLHADRGDEAARTWTAAHLRLAERLYVRAP